MWCSYTIAMTMCIRKVTGNVIQLSLLVPKSLERLHFPSARWCDMMVMYVMWYSYYHLCQSVEQLHCLSARWCDVIVMYVMWYSYYHLCQSVEQLHCLSARWCDMTVMYVMWYSYYYLCQSLEWFWSGYTVRSKVMWHDGDVCNVIQLLPLVQVFKVILFFKLQMK